MKQIGRLSTFACLILSTLVWFGVRADASEWPDNQWLEGRPNSDSILSAVAFISPTDFQFLKMMNVWKKLDKKYHALKIDFLMVARSEPLLPFSEELIRNELAENSYHLPVYIDPQGNYSKLWRAYVTPTVDLVLKNGKVISFDPGNFDPGQFEKILQKTIRENGQAGLPPREYATEGETKTCGHSRTVFFGKRFQKTWASMPFLLGENWNLKSLWLEKEGNETATIETIIDRMSVALLAESKSKTPVRVVITLDGKKLSSEIKGRDIEDKTGTSLLLIKGKRLYEIINHSVNLGENPARLKLTTGNQNLRFWSLQMIPACQDFGS